MKTKTLATVVILICSFVLAPTFLRAEENEWYQGQQGQWQRHGNNWLWKSTHGDEWYQGRPGRWYQEKEGWEWRGNDGDDYRQGRNGWQWYGNGPCEKAQRLENQARLDRRSGHPEAAEDLDRQAAAARAACYRR
jgi:hypothetical protein